MTDRKSEQRVNRSNACEYVLRYSLVHIYIYTWYIYMYGCMLACVRTVRACGGFGAQGDLSGQQVEQLV